MHISLTVDGVVCVGCVRFFTGLSSEHTLVGESV